MLNHVHPGYLVGETDLAPESSAPPAVGGAGPLLYTRRELHQLPGYHVCRRQVNSRIVVAPYTSHIFLVIRQGRPGPAIHRW